MQKEKRVKNGLGFPCNLLEYLNKRRKKKRRNQGQKSSEIFE